MALSKSKCWYSNNCLHLLRRTVPLICLNFFPDCWESVHPESGGRISSQGWTGVITFFLCHWLGQNKLECLSNSNFSSFSNVWSKALCLVSHLGLFPPLLPNISLGWKNLCGTNTLAFYCSASVTNKKVYDV